jgi:hypothetical protein
MANAQDRDDVVALPRIEQTLLWAIRTWVLGRQTGEDMSFKLESVFRHVGATDAAVALQGLLWVLSQGLTRTLQVNCTCQMTVSADEDHLLQLFCLLGDDRVEDAESLLRGFAAERVALLAADCALRVVLELAASGYHLGRHGPGLPLAASRPAVPFPGAHGPFH